jgi:hypothetical protein
MIEYFQDNLSMPRRLSAGTLLLSLPGPIDLSAIAVQTMQDAQKAVQQGRVEGLNDARTPLAGFFSILLGFRLDTFNIEPYLDLVTDHEPAAVQCLVPDHTVIFAVELPFCVETGPGIAPRILRRPIIVAD